MKKGFITAYSIVAFVVLAVAVAWFCISVFSEASRGNEEAERTFSWLCRETAQNSYSLGFMSDAYVEQTTALCQGVNSLVAITISSPTETFYAWPKDSPALAYTSDESIEIKRTSLFSKIMDAGVDMGANSSPAIRVTASLQTLSPSVVFAASRNSFILVFLVLLSSIIVLLAAPGQAAAKPSKKEDKTDKRKEDKSDKSKSAFDFDSSAYSQKNDFSSLSQAEEPNDYSFSSSFQESKKDYASFAQEDAPYNEEKEDELPNAETSFAEDAPLAESDDEAAQEAYAESSYSDDAYETGRYSQGSGFGREHYLEERLNSELIRAASADRDVSILILRIFGMKRSDEAFLGISKILINMFTYRDLIFEFGEDAEACILPSATLDETMQAAEQLYGLVHDYLTEQDLPNRVCIGISTRMTRAVPASRMIREADTAARKAEEEERLPIVAFRANPEKYKDYMARNPSAD